GTASAWKVAREREGGPVALSLTRQKVPTLPRGDGYGPAAGLERGAYVYWDSDASPRLVLIATGSEVSLCVEAAKRLPADGAATRVDSLPCWGRLQARRAG